MPYTWVKPEVAYQYKDIVIYHCYKDDFIKNKLVYHFTLSDDSVEWHDDMFDIRDTRAWKTLHIVDDEAPLIDDVLHEFCKSGEYKDYEVEE